MRKYAWIAVIAVIALVGATAYREFSISAKEKIAQETGDAITAALKIENSADRAAALAKITNTDESGKAVVSLLQASANALASDVHKSVDILEKLSVSNVPSAYTELANFKKLLFDTEVLNTEQRIEELERITASASPFNLLAEEQLALIDISSGRIEIAISRLIDIIENANASESLRQRASQLILALGVNPDLADG